MIYGCSLFKFGWGDFTVSSARIVETEQYNSRLVLSAPNEVHVAQPDLANDAEPHDAGQRLQAHIEHAGEPVGVRTTRLRSAQRQCQQQQQTTNVQRLVLDQTGSVN